MRSSAQITEDRAYRYLLHREWRRNAGTVVFVMLNPSRAAETTDDPTIRRCIGFADRWGYGAMVVANLYAYRTPDPVELFHDADDPVGPENDEVLRSLPKHYDFIVCAWGANAPKARVKQFLELMGDAKLYHLGITMTGNPKHPLYLPKDVTPELWTVTSIPGAH